VLNKNKEHLPMTNTHPPGFVALIAATAIVVSILGPLGQLAARASGL
jgi:hypothetical protein